MIAHLLVSLAVPVAAGSLAATTDTDPRNDRDITSEMVDDLFATESDTICAEYEDFVALFDELPGLEAADVQGLIRLGDAYLADTFEESVGGRLTVEGHDRYVENLHQCGLGTSMVTDDTLFGSDTGLEPVTGVTAPDVGSMFDQLGLNLTDEQIRCLAGAGDRLQDMNQAMQIMAECEIDLNDLMGSTSGG